MVIARSCPASKSIEAGHPHPDDKSVEAGRRVADLAKRADARSLVINVVSGGGSALLCAPLSYEGDGVSIHLTLREKQGMTKALLACGAEIHEFNCLRKHVSSVKGGRLLELLSPARSLNLILSDVVGDDLDTIASGLTHHDRSTYADALRIVEKYGLESKLPRAILDVFTLGAEDRIPETLKLGDPTLALATNILIGTNLAALRAACEKARSLGYNTAALTSSITGEAREVAKVLFSVAVDVRKHDLLVAKPAFVVAGGETVVTLTGNGRGGRNQEMALAFLAEMASDKKRGRAIHFLSAATDGSDGPTDAAGAFASAQILDAADRAGLSIGQALRNNDSYVFFERLNQLLKTGPTMTNVCDLHMAIVD